jgi:hypothetical protein
MVIVLIGLIFSAGLLSESFGRERGRRSGGSGHVEKRRYGHHRPGHRQYRYSYRRGRFFRISPFGRIVVGAPFGRIVVGLPIGYRTIYCGGLHFFYYDGIFYRRHLHGYEIVRAPRVRFVPHGARRLLINGTVYFVHDDVYYCRRGGYYEVCESPVIVEKDSPQTTTIMVPNSNGSRTPVELEPLGANQWKGPRGEIYDGLPSEEQLQEGYGF